MLQPLDGAARQGVDYWQGTDGEDEQTGAVGVQLTDRLTGVTGVLCIFLPTFQNAVLCVSFSVVMLSQRWMGQADPPCLCCLVYTHTPFTVILTGDTQVKSFHRNRRRQSIPAWMD